MRAVHTYLSQLDLDPPNKTSPTCLSSLITISYIDFLILEYLT